MYTDANDPALPGPAKTLLRRPGGRRFARAVYRGLQRTTMPLRRRYYLGGGGAGAIERLPGPARELLGLADTSAVGSRRLEIGCGPHGQPGYLHLDLDRGAPHLEWAAPMWDLPLPDGWAEEIVAVHALEHVEPPNLVPTLQEWLRVLAPGGRVQVHVPNGPELMQAFVDAPVEEKWPIMGSILGMYCGPEARDPRELDLRSDHQLVLDAPLLRWAFEQAGFEDVQDLTETTTDRHAAAWIDVVPHYSLVVAATKPAPG